MNLKNLKRWFPLLIIVILMAAAFLTGLHEKVSLQALQDNKEALSSLVSGKPILTALGFIAIYIAFVALSLPAATLLTLTGGFLFGTWLGTLYVVSAATIGATIIFMIAKTSLGETLREKVGGLYKRIEKNMDENAAGYLLFMRLVPVFPFFLVNIVPALFNVKLRIFILTTFFGIMPGSFVFVNLGRKLGDITSLNDLVSTDTILAFALLGVFALLPTLYKQIKARKKTLVVALLSLSFLSSANAYADNQYDPFLKTYDSLLGQYVLEVKDHESGIVFNGVDYDGWEKDQRHERAKALLQGIDPEPFVSKNEQMAFWINAYNFLTIDLILSEGERETIKNLGSLFTSPWKKHSWSLAGKDYTLDQIEHKILRPLGDPRIHFAINCASISCPDLRPESYNASKLEQQLDEQTKETLKNENKGVRVDRSVVYVSKIFDWFDDDFNSGDVKSWLNTYARVEEIDKVEFLEYNWFLNKVSKK